MSDDERNGFYRVVAPTFVCGVEVRDGIVTRTAPPLDWLVAWRKPWPLHRLRAYATRRRWLVERLI